MKDMNDLYDRFRTFKVDVCGRNERTLDDYITTIKNFCKEMGIKTIDEFVGIKAQDIRDWLSKMAHDRKNSEVTRNKKLTLVKEIYKFLLNQEHYEIDRDIQYISFAKVPKRESKYTTQDEMISLLYATTNLRVRCCMKIIMSTGMRFSEVLQLTCSDIERGYAYIIGKGNKERKVTFSQSCITECQRYMKRMRNKIVEKYNLNTDILFLNDNGKLYTIFSFDKSLKYYAKRAGIEWYVDMSAHKLRHGFITHKLEKGVPIHIVSSAVGHSSTATTSIYAHANQRLVDEMFMEE